MGKYRPTEVKDLRKGLSVALKSTALVERATQIGIVLNYYVGPKYEGDIIQEQTYDEFKSNIPDYVKEEYVGSDSPGMFDTALSISLMNSDAVLYVVHGNKRYLWDVSECWIMY